jgi:hypothetical protein
MDDVGEIPGAHPLAEMMLVLRPSDDQQRALDELMTGTIRSGFSPLPSTAATRKLWATFRHCRQQPEKDTGPASAPRHDVNEVSGSRRIILFSVTVLALVGILTDPVKPGAGERKSGAVHSA